MTCEVTQGQSEELDWKHCVAIYLRNKVSSKFCFSHVWQHHDLHASSRHMTLQVKPFFFYYDYCFRWPLIKGSIVNELAIYCKSKLREEKW